MRLVIWNGWSSRKNILIVIYADWNILQYPKGMRRNHSFTYLPSWMPKFTFLEYALAALHSFTNWYIFMKSWSHCNSLNFLLTFWKTLQLIFELNSPKKLVGLHKSCHWNSFKKFNKIIKVVKLLLKDENIIYPKIALTGIFNYKFLSGISNSTIDKRQFGCILFFLIG
jgi:hypothetical protein